MNEQPMRTLRFHEYGPPGDVLRLEEAPVPVPAADRIRVAVQACGLNPADWALCRGLFAGKLPRGVGLDVAGVVDAVGERVVEVRVGDRVMGAADFAGYASAGASEFAILETWARLPLNVDSYSAAALPLAVETASRHLDAMGIAPGQTVLIHGAGTTIGFAAVQIAMLRGAHVLATAGETHAERLRGMGALVTSYGEGMVERIEKLSAAPIDAVLDTAPAPADPELAHALIMGTADRSEDTAASGPLVELVRAVGGDAARVVTISDFKTAVKLGVRTTFDLLRAAGAIESNAARSQRLAKLMAHAADGKLSVPIARTFALEDWRAALDISLSGRARGKLLLLPRPQAPR